MKMPSLLPWVFSLDYRTYKFTAELSRSIPQEKLPLSAVYLLGKYVDRRFFIAL